MGARRLRPRDAADHDARDRIFGGPYGDPSWFSLIGGILFVLGFLCCIAAAFCMSGSFRRRVGLAGLAVLAYVGAISGAKVIHYFTFGPYKDWESRKDVEAFGSIDYLAVEKAVRGSASFRAIDPARAKWFIESTNGRYPVIYVGDFRGRSATLRVREGGLVERQITRDNGELMWVETNDQFPVAADVRRLRSVILCE